MPRDKHDYTIEVCIVCGGQLSRGTPAGRCVDRTHWSQGGMVVRVLARPIDDQPKIAAMYYDKIPEASTCPD